jgi:arginyl-tRNA synthetase
MVCRYDSTDLAAIKYRLQDLERDWVIYITDAGQSEHFHLIFDGARIAGRGLRSLKPDRPLLVMPDYDDVGLEGRMGTRGQVSVVDHG